MKSVVDKSGFVIESYRTEKGTHSLISGGIGYYKSKKQLKKEYGFKERRTELEIGNNSDGWEIKIAPGIQSDLEKEFNELAKNWKKQTAHYSTMFHKLNNSNYLKIMARGPDVVPYILKDLERSPDLWHEALYLITKESPIKGEDINDVYKIREAWLKWGKENGKI